MMGLDSHVGDLGTRMRLLDFSTTHCPAEEIVSTLQSKKLLRLQVCTQTTGIHIHLAHSTSVVFDVLVMRLILMPGANNAFFFVGPAVQMWWSG